MNKTEESLINIFNEKYKNWEIYKQHLVEDEKSFKEETEKFTKNFGEDSDVDAYKERVEFKSYDLKLKQKDLDFITHKLISTFETIEKIGLLEQVEDDKKDAINNEKEIFKQNFFANNSGIKEIKKGFVKNFIQDIKKSPAYKKAMKQVEKNFL